MKGKFKYQESRGLPGGPNEMFTYVTGVFSTEGYKRNSPDVNNPYNVIPSGNITMKGVDFPVVGTDNLGNTKMMMPGKDYKFPGDMVFEIPVAQEGNGETPLTRKEIFNVPRTMAYEDGKMVVQDKAIWDGFLDEVTVTPYTQGHHLSQYMINNKATGGLEPVYPVFDILSLGLKTPLQAGAKSFQAAVKKAPSKINPRYYNPTTAAKGNPDVYYRTVGKDAYQDFVKSGFVRTQAEVTDNPIIGLLETQKELGQVRNAIKDYGQFTYKHPTNFRAPYFSRGRTADMTSGGGDYLIQTRPGLVGDDAFISGQMNVLHGAGNSRVAPGGYGIMDPMKRSADNFDVFKKSWWHGYKPIKQEGGEETSWSDYINPMNWGVTNRDEDGNFKQAFRAARNAGDDEFMWHGTRYNTELAPSEPTKPQEQKPSYNPNILKGLSEEQAARRQALLNAADVVANAQGNDENLRRLLVMSAVMESTLGADANAYGRDYTRGPMSIDDIAYQDLFAIREGARGYTAQQKKNAEWLNQLGLDASNIEQSLRSDDPLAGMAAARLVYGRAPEALPSGEDPDALYNYYLKYYNKGGVDKYGGADAHKKKFTDFYNQIYRQEGGEQNQFQIYKDYVYGVYDGTEMAKAAEKVYDKLNRVYYKEAKQSGTTVPNYILSTVMKQANN